jgi:signal transduction histidine kinase/DNA-binding response OmpR family regulator
MPLKLQSNLICDIISDGEYLWLTTSKGLIRFLPENKELKIFNKADGLQSDQFNIKSSIKASDGKIYVGTSNGFNGFYPQNVIDNNYIPPVVITKLQIFNNDVTPHSGNILRKTIDHTNTIILSHKQAVFNLEFAALSFHTPGKNQYAYMLKGLDKEWNYVGNHRIATYNNLPAGTYTFKVKASNNNNIWNEEGTTMTIIIKPPVWLSKGFILLYVLLSISLIFFIILYYTKHSKRKHEEELQQLNIQKEKEVHKAKIAFFTLVAHEIRTPVSLIIAPLEKIMSDMKFFPEQVQDDLNIIFKNSKRLLFLINQLLDFRKAEQQTSKLTFTRQNIYELLKNIFDRFKPSVEQKRCTIIFQADNEYFEAMVDSEVLTKSVSNLLSNALKYTKDRIEIQLQSANSSQLQTFKITVTDNGVGIAPEKQEIIFKPFYQVDENNAGTGIGLSLIKALVEAHNGKIELSSIPGQKTSFSIILPVEQQEITSHTDFFFFLFSMNSFRSVKPEHKNLQVVNKEEYSPKLLIVEDNIDMQDFLCKNFTANYDVYIESNGKKGLEFLKSNMVDIIVSDIMMPEMDGIEFCIELKKDIFLSHIPIILLTAKTDTVTKVEAMNSGADDYIEKPFSLQYLEAKLVNLLESRKALQKKFSKMPFVPLSSIAANKADDEFLLKLNAIIVNHITDTDFSINQLANELCVSRSGLFAKIKSLTDVTPNELIHVIRLKKAAELLSQNKYRINEICYLVGFNNPSYFAKCFQKQFGILPKEFVNKFEI